ncbi:MAG TPA: diguanylate cyclase [Chloroflexi bacterium]|nr:diguanylate cyclase [Chloroflexota bacterium]
MTAPRQIHRIGSMRMDEGKNGNLGMSQEEQTLLGMLKKHLYSLFPVNAVYILLAEGARLQVVASWHSATHKKATRPFSEGDTIAWEDWPVLEQMLDTREPLLLEDVQASPLWSRPEGGDVSAWMGTPLLVEGEILGVLWLEASASSAFTPDDLNLLSALAEYAGFALQAFRQYVATRCMLYRETRLNEAARKISHALDVPLVFQIGAQQASLLFDAYAVCFVQRDDEGKLRYAYTRNLPASVNSGTLVPPQDLLWRVVRTGTSMMLTEYAAHPAANSQWVAAGLGACLGVPLRADKRILGALYIFRQVGEPPFDIADLSALETWGEQVGIALQTAMLFAKERQRADELGALRDVLEDFSAQLDMPDLLQAILRRAAALLLATGGELGLYEPERGGIHVVASYNMGESYYGMFIPVGQGVMGTVVQTGNFLMLEDYHSWDKSLPGYRSSNCRAVIAMPLRARGRLLGVISIIDAKAGRKFTENDVRILKMFAQQAAIAVDNAHLFENAHKRAEEAETLRQVSLVVAGLLDEKDAIRKILELLGHVVVCDTAVVVLKEGKDTLRVVGEHQWKKNPSMLGMEFSIFGITPYAEVARRIEPRLVSDAVAHYPHLPRDERSAYIRSWLGVPLIAHDDVLGVIAVHSTLPNYFTQSNLRLLSAFGSHVSVAISNARLYEEAQRLAITDPLTQLFNRRYFFQIASLEFRRAVRHHTPLSVLMIDIDRFKRVNDTYGHQIGDVALQKVAAACKRSIREIDILARYGGEEFIVLLPDTDADGAMRVAHRLHEAVGAQPLQANGHEILVTVSVGGAMMTEKMTELDILIARADQALYQAKKAGRNRVMFWKDE